VGQTIGNGKATEPGVAADSAEAAEEAGLRYVNDERPGVQPQSERQRLRVFGHGRKNNSATSSGCSGSNASRFHQHGLRFGFVRQRMATSRRQVATRVAGSSIAITSAGAKSATKTSSTDSAQFGQSAAEYSPASCPGPEVAESASAKSVRDDRAAFGANVYTHRKRRIRTRKQVIRFDHS